MTAPIHRFSHEAMATVFEVRCAHAESTYAGQAARAAFDLVDRLEQELSRFIGNSDVSRINELRPGEHTRVSAATMECLEIARRMYEVTGGAFDVSLGSGLDGLELLPEEFTVRARAAGVRLDLGGIGKGYAVDQMAELLVEWDVSQALVHGGFSSVRALEAPPDGEGWPLTLSAPGPGEPAVLERLSVARQAWSASGTRKGPHIVDPRNGRPVEGRAAWVTVASEATPSPATVAEALSTAFMILAAEEIAALCGSSPGLSAWLFLEPAAAGGSQPTFVHFGRQR